ncbi:exopolysaccharide biosynthesis protein [Martelella soudanensis]|uniref:exopolysaccharide biosynthesis protein n=1 Tax=unclassified Martelella TaxID=2629616 RepID=UPI0015DFD5B2|nr:MULTISPECIES: exopolysaccharide biosynthesis protein [unclassified Martelella]
MSPAASSEREFHSLTEIVEQTMEEAGDGHISVDHLMSSFGHASFVPLLVLPALVLITPLSGVPGLSTVCGLIIMMIAAQQLVGHSQIWLPRWIRNRQVNSDKLHPAMRRLLPLTRLIDRAARERLTFLFKPPFLWLLPLSCVIFGAMMPLMEFIPFSSSLIGVAVTLIAFSILTRDGIFALFALVPLGVVIWGVTSVLSSL